VPRGGEYGAVMTGQSGVGAGQSGGPGSGVAGEKEVLRDRERGNPLLGIVAFVIAVLVFVALPVVLIVVAQSANLGAASAVSGRVAAVQLVALIAASGLGIVAVMTRRGRSWGIAALAIVVGLLLVGLALPLISSLMVNATPGG
jgi:hypothetical protein